MGASLLTPGKSIIHCHTIFWETEGLGGGVVRENNANWFLLRMTNLLIFIHNGGI